MGAQEGPADRIQQAEALFIRGRSLLGQGRVSQARALFQAAALSSIPAALNALALLQLDYDSDPQQALRTLIPNLLDDRPQPVAHAVAARCHAQLGTRDEGQLHLEKAVCDLEAALSRTPEGLVGALREHTALVLQASGDLGDDQRTWDLYQRWRLHHALPVSHFLGGTAAFNLGRYDAALRVWRQVHHPDWAFLTAYAAVAEWMARGVIPPVRLPYTPPSREAPVFTAARDSDRLGEVAARFVADPRHLMLLLASLLLPRPGTREDASALIAALVAGGGAWGSELARRLFAADRVPSQWKMAALEGLHQAGIVRVDEPVFDEPVFMVIDGQDHAVTLSRVEVIPGIDPELERTREAALSLLVTGQLDEARRLLRDLVEGPFLYGPAALTYAEVLWRQGDREGARRWLTILHEILPNNPVILYDLALVCADLDPEAALGYLDEIDPADVDGELSEKVASLSSRLEALLLPALLARRAEEEFRQRAESRSLSPVRLTLHRALDTIPAEWLNAACRFHGLAPAARLRRDRAAQLAQLLLRDPARAVERLVPLDPEGTARRLLQYLVDRGGWADASQVTRRFGSDSQDGYFWTEDPPRSPLGLLRWAALAFVGRSLVGRAHKRVAIVPCDLREPLRDLFTRS